jgi:pilus assembly protein Flp/PilA
MEKLATKSLELHTRVMNRVRELNREEGQGLVEYALILVLVSIISIAVLGVLGVDVDGVFEQVETALDGNDADGATETD